MVGIYKKVLPQISVYSRQFFFLIIFLVLVYIYKTVDSIDIYKSLNNNIGTVKLQKC